MLCFFFFKQKTAYEMRISDWSSDVCSSDLTSLDKFRANEGGSSLSPTVWSSVRQAEMDEAHLVPFGVASISAVKIRPVERARTGVALIGSAMCQRRRMGGIDRRRVVAQKSGHDAVPRRRGLAVLRLADPAAPFVA